MKTARRIEPFRDPRSCGNCGRRLGSEPVVIELDAGAVGTCDRCLQKAVERTESRRKWGDRSWR
jgi:alkylation response protein AidB-like acyl-CoA dehydrogenase